MNRRSPSGALRSHDPYYLGHGRHALTTAAGEHHAGRRGRNRVNSPASFVAHGSEVPRAALPLCCPAKPVEPPDPVEQPRPSPDSSRRSTHARATPCPRGVAARHGALRIRRALHRGARRRRGPADGVGGPRTSAGLGDVGGRLTPKRCPAKAYKAWNRIHPHPSGP